MARGKATGRYGPSRRGGQQEDETNRWLGTYGDAVTLLMAFFVMLYAMSQIDQAKFEAFVTGLEGPFGNPASAEMLDAAPAIVGDAGAEQPALEPGAVTAPSFTEPVQPLKPLPDAATPAPTEAAPPLPAVELDRMEEVSAAITASLAAQGLTDAADLAIDHRGLVVSISADQVLFATGSTDISELGRRVVRAVAEPLSATDNDLLVEGHTDDVPLHRGGYSNWNLSTDRAVAVLTLLYSDAGIAQQRLGAIGYGEFRPRVPNDSPQHRSINRRVDILVVASDKE